MENREAIEYLMDVRNGIHIPSPGRELPLCNEQEKKAIDMAISALKKQDADRWIPCSERLPEENGRYIICYEDVTTLLDYFNGKWYFGKNGMTYEETGTIIAWRPLPEPYTEEK